MQRPLFYLTNKHKECYNNDDQNLFPHIVHGLFLDLNIYYPSLAIREQLQRAVKEATERIAEAAKKMEADGRYNPMGNCDGSINHAKNGEGDILAINISSF